MQDPVFKMDGGKAEGLNFKEEAVRVYKDSHSLIQSREQILAVDSCLNAHCLQVEYFHKVYLDA